MPPFRRKSQTSTSTEAEGPVVVERTDDASTSVDDGQGGLPPGSVQGKRIGCGSAVLTLTLLVVALAAAAML